MLEVADSATAAVAPVHDGACVMIGGFGVPGQPVEPIEALIVHGASGLTVVSNNAGNGDVGLAELIRLGRVRKVICSCPRQAEPWHFDERYRAGRIKLEVVPRDIPARSCVALGIGQPTLVSDHLGPADHVTLRTENGMVGMGGLAHGEDGARTSPTPARLSWWRRGGARTSTTRTPSP